MRADALDSESHIHTVHGILRDHAEACEHCSRVLRVEVGMGRNAQCEKWVRRVNWRINRKWRPVFVAYMLGANGKIAEAMTHGWQ